MKAVLDTDIRRFAETTMAWVNREPVVNNVLATNADAVLAGRREYDDALWLTVLDDAGEVVGAAMQTPPHRLFVCPMPDEAARVLAGALAGVRPALPGVGGVLGPATAFAEAWQQVPGAVAVPARNERLYALDVLVAPAGVPGRARLATEADLQLLIDWSLAFHHEATADQPGAGIAGVVKSRIGEGGYHLWELDGAPVCFAGASPPAAGIARIGPVYTPPAHRRHGYASACVSAASRHALADGAAGCMLYTDLGNRTSNAIYQQIGYRPVCDSGGYAFSYPPGGAIR